MKRSKWIWKDLINCHGWDGISEYYRDRTGCLIYLSEDKQDIYVDVPFDGEYLSSDNSKNSGAAYYGCTPLLFMIANYLRVTKVMLRNNKSARRWFNRVVKNNFQYAGRPFKNYFLPNGEVNWDLVIEAGEFSLQNLEFVMYCDGINWNGYNPLWNCEQYNNI